jgi:hypothetical protein
MTDPTSLASKELAKVDPLVIDFAEERYITPSAFNLRAHVQGEIVFIGQHWMYESEARALRDWLNKVLP